MSPVDFNTFACVLKKQRRKKFCLGISFKHLRLFQKITSNRSVKTKIYALIYEYFLATHTLVYFGKYALKTQYVLQNPPIQYDCINATGCFAA